MLCTAADDPGQRKKLGPSAGMLTAKFECLMSSIVFSTFASSNLFLKTLIGILRLPGQAENLENPNIESAYIACQTNTKFGTIFLFLPLKSRTCQISATSFE